MEVVELPRFRQSRQRNFASARVNRRDRQHGKRHQNQFQVFVCANDLRNLWSRLPAIGTIEIIELEEGDIPVSLPEHDDAGQPFDLACKLNRYTMVRDW